MVSGKKNILVVDDHVVVREALIELLTMQPDIRVISGVGSLREAGDVLASQPVDLVLLDYDLGCEVVIDFIQQHAQLDSPPVLIWSAGISTAALRRLITMGAAGVVHKELSFRELMRSVRTTLAARPPLVDWARQVPASNVRPVFTQRQLQVADAVLDGKATKEIAACLGVSDSSVKCTMQQLFAKTGQRSRSQLVKALLERYPQELGRTHLQQAAATARAVA